MVKVLLIFSQTHVEFRTAEFKSIFDLFGIYFNEKQIQAKVR